MRGKEAHRILLVDDDIDLLELLQYNFEKDGFEVKIVRHGEKAVSAARKFKPDLVVLDIMMPETNGMAICKALRTESSLRNTYIFFLTAHSENTFRFEAFENGADDFIEKLSGIRALTNKVRAVLINDFIIKKGIPSLSGAGLIVDNRSEVVHLGNQRIKLSRSELEILFFLMQNASKVISVENIIGIIWGSGMYIPHSSVRSCIESLRTKVGKERIELLHDGKYRFNHTIH